MMLLASWLLWLGCTGSTPSDSVDTDTDIEVVDTSSVVDTDTDVPPPAWPSSLAATGLYADITTGSLAAGVLQYEVAWPLWSDTAAKGRYLWLPPGETIDVSNPDIWQVPVGTKVWKSFTRDGVLVETRYIERLEEDWVWVAYQWREDGSDADPVPDGVEDASGTSHDIPSTSHCNQCHSGDGLIGVNAIQLGVDSPTGTLEALSSGGFLSASIDQSTAVPGEGTVRDALGYLHGNCGNCHADHYGLADNYGLRLRVAVGTSSPEETATYLTGINAPTKHETSTTVAIVPGDPEASQVYERMALRTFMAMPPVGTELVDSQALALVHAWISGLAE
jgi:hypothetical protein